jgi:hypothetical protein
LVIASKTPILEVKEIRDVPRPDKAEGFPSIEVVIRIAGLTLTNPVNGNPLLSRERFKEYFESWPVQRGVLLWLGRYIADCIPANSPEVRLKRKFRTVGQGRPSALPPRADMRFRYDQLVRQLGAVQKWLRSRHKGTREFTEKDREGLLNEAPRDSFWWLYLVERRDLTLPQIEDNTPQSTALLILTLHFHTQEDAIRSRLFRPEK